MILYSLSWFELLSLLVYYLLYWPTLVQCGKDQQMGMNWALLKVILFIFNFYCSFGDKVAIVLLLMVLMYCTTTWVPYTCHHCPGSLLVFIFSHLHNLLPALLDSSVLKSKDKGLSSFTSAYSLVFFLCITEISEINWYLCFSLWLNPLTLMPQ